MEGWISLHRKLLENPIVMKDSDYLAVWIYLLLNATHHEYPALFDGKKITLKPGQLITGRKSISAALNISESKVTRILNCFKNEHQIEQQTSNKNRLISLINWDVYQEFEQQTEHQVNINRTTTEHQVNTNNNVNNEIMEQCNNKHSNKDQKDPFVVFKESDPDLFQALKDFEKMRKAIKKPMTDRSKSMLLTKLEAFQKDQWIPILHQSIDHCWASVYELKGSSSAAPARRLKNQVADYNSQNIDLEQLKKLGDRI